MVDLQNDYYDTIIISVLHNCFFDYGIKKIKSAAKKKSILFDLKAMLSRMNLI